MIDYGIEADDESARTEESDDETTAVSRETSILASRRGVLTVLGTVGILGTVGTGTTSAEVLSGVGNSAPEETQVVAGGEDNRATGTHAVVTGGLNNRATGAFAAVLGGRCNGAEARGATVGGGGDTGDDWFPEQAGGENRPNGNRALDEYCTVSGGILNRAGSDDQTRKSASEATVGGGRGNTASGEQTTVSDGDYNTATGRAAAISGGIENTASDAAAVGGGVRNTASHGGSVSGGTKNTANEHGAAVGGGEENTASDYQTTVSGGLENTACGYQTTVGGGYDNAARSFWTTVGGGYSNTASGADSTVSGGNRNTASGNYATIPDGRSNTASGTTSFAAGRDAKTESADGTPHDGAVVFADATDTEFRSQNPNEFRSQMPMYAPAFNTTSARTKKQSIDSVDSGTVLDRVTDFEVSTWEFKETEGGRHMGPMAREFRETFGLGDDNGSIASVDADGVALAAIKGLADRLDQCVDDLTERLAKRDDRIADLKAENERKDQRIDDLESRLENVERAIDAFPTSDPTQIDR